ncbi:MAG: signal peptidase I [Pseudohongiellaceae bacterium]
MNVDFSLILVILVAVCGVLWLLDALFLKKPRQEALRRFNERHSGKADERTQQERADLQREPVVVEYAKSFFPVLLIVLMLRSFIIEPFQIPTGSMIPTLAVGDFILVNKYSYGLRLPVLGTKIMDVNEPQRGEVMVFIPPHDPKYFIKRVIGIPGDRIRYEDKQLYVNGESVPREYVEPESPILTACGPLPGAVYNEEIGGVVHRIQLADIPCDTTTRTTWVVPEGQYFMMGDNRDSSSDSRFWGMASEEQIVGRAVAIWMHKEPGLHLPEFSRNQLIR